MKLCDAKIKLTIAKEIVMPRPVVMADQERPANVEEDTESRLRRMRRERQEAARIVRQRGRTAPERRIGADTTAQLRRRGQATTTAGRSPARGARAGAPAGRQPERRTPPNRRSR